ncbi:sugar ABC transporter ATP-binding protein [Pilibacter termitis]|nr:sugar ABC transporter ATP-binding protein [Pilibacter termitis]
MRNVRKTFGPVVALDQVDLLVKEQEIHAICGENGAGKSTLMNVLSGVYPYGSYSGEIDYDGKVRQFKNLRDSEKEGIVIIHQELALIPYLSIMENIFLGNEQVERGSINWDKTKEKAIELMDRVGLDADPEELIVNIGVGKQQLVEIAKAMAKDVRLLILDEPTAALNEDDSEHLLGLIRNLRDNNGITAIIISHKLNEIAAIADMVTVIRDGKSISKIEITETSPLDEDKLIADMVGRSLEARYPEHKRNEDGEVIFETIDWTVYHNEDTHRLVNDKVNIQVKAGEIIGIAGLMGSGRTEFAMSVFGKSYGSKIQGTLRLNGKEVNLKNVGQAIHHKLAYVSEDRKVYGLNLISTIRENTTLSNLNDLLKGFSIDREKEKAIAEKYRKELRTKSASIESKCSELSGGNQQKVVLSKWIYTNPDIMILDEPTRGIDVGAKYEIYEIIHKLADQGKAIIVISSELPELLGISDRVYTMAEGKVTANLVNDDLTQDDLMKKMTA